MKKRLQPDNKPRLFIASSAESIDEVNEMHCLLDHDAWVTPWNLLFELSDLTLQKLTETLDNFDFAAFIFAPNDIVRIRKQTLAAVRDNVLFELGLFIGRLGRKRTFLVTPRGISNFRLPTDLLSITTATYEAKRPDGELKLALNPACTEIRGVMKRLGLVPVHRKPRKSQNAYEKDVTRLLGKGVPVAAVKLPKTRKPPSEAATVARRKIRVLPNKQTRSKRPRKN